MNIENRHYFGPRWEPVIHSHITDCLDDDDPRETVLCKSCGAVVHAPVNECMRTWIETGEGNYCLRCWVALVQPDDIDVLDDWWGLCAPPKVVSS